MYLDARFKVDEVTPERVKMHTFNRSHFPTVVNDGSFDVSEGHVIDAQIENHSRDDGLWVMDELRCFPYRP